MDQDKDLEILKEDTFLADKITHEEVDEPNSNIIVLQYLITISWHQIFSEVQDTFVNDWFGQ